MSENQRFRDESNADLVRLIRDEIAEQGPMRFDRFMELALYHPEYGYYHSQAPGPGRSGDFLTAPEAHPIFGATLASQIVDFDRLLGQPAAFTVIEFGAGTGRLIRPLLAELRQSHDALYERLTYVPIETNRSRLSELREHLQSGDHDQRLVDTGQVGLTGCILANEFLDAIPVRRFSRRHSQLAEACVEWDGNWFVESLLPVGDASAFNFLERHGYSLSDGEWVEFAPGIEGWARQAGEMMKRGFVLLIDYGYPANELYREHRRHGTMKAYFQHGTSNEFYRGVGNQDLTAHVNFSEVEYQLARNGFDALGMTTQSELLATLGIGERLTRLQSVPDLESERYLGIRAAVMRMIDPGAMGRFRVAFFAKGRIGSRNLTTLKGPGR